MTDDSMLTAENKRLLPARLLSNVVWELRTAWATGRRVSISMDNRSRFPRLEGHISAVAGTGAYVRLAGHHVPVDVILAVHLPSRLGDSTARGDHFHGPSRRAVPQDEELFKVAESESDEATSAASRDTYLREFPIGCRVSPTNRGRVALTTGPTATGGCS